MPNNDDDAPPTCMDRIGVLDAFTPAVVQRGSVSGILATLLVPLVALAIAAVLIWQNETRPDITITELIELQSNTLVTVNFVCPSTCVIAPLYPQDAAQGKCKMGVTEITRSFGVPTPLKLCFMNTNMDYAVFVNNPAVAPLYLTVGTFNPTYMNEKGEVIFLEDAVSNSPYSSLSVPPTQNVTYSFSLNVIFNEYSNKTTKVLGEARMDPFLQQSGNLSPAEFVQLSICSQPGACPTFTCPSDKCHGSFFSINRAAYRFKTVSGKFTALQVIGQIGGFISLAVAFIRFGAGIARAIELCLVNLISKKDK